MDAAGTGHICPISPLIDTHIQVHSTIVEFVQVLLESKMQ